MKTDKNNHLNDIERDFSWDNHYIASLEDLVRDFEEKYFQLKAENEFLRLELDKLKESQK
jgi:hypothetical protein